MAAALENVRKIEAEPGRPDTSRTGSGIHVGLRENMSGREYLMPGGSITLPILDNGEPAIAIQKARLNKPHGTSGSQRNGPARSQTTSTRLMDARRQASSVGQLDAAIRAQERSDSAYAEGEVDLNTLLLTQRQRIEVERALVKMQFETMQAMCMLRQAVGGSFEMEEDLIPIIEIQARPQRVSKEQSP